MVASQKTMDALRTIGLNKYERNLWSALLSRGASTAGELSDISKVPRSRCYDVLESLAARGFIVIQTGKPMKYVAISPSEAIERAKKKLDEDYKERVEKMNRFIKSDSIKELEKLHKENIKTVRPEDLTGTIRGRPAMAQQTESMLKNAKKSAKLLTTEAGLLELHGNHKNHMKKVAESGVKISILAPLTKSNQDAAAELSKYAQIRNLASSGEKISGRFCIIDGREFMVGLTDDAKTHPTQDVSVWTQSDHAASQIFEPMFENLWKNSKPAEK